jgi:hypothetical protein
MENRVNTKLNNRKEATFVLIDVAIPLKRNVTEKESEKKVNTTVDV